MKIASVLLATGIAVGSILPTASVHSYAAETLPLDNTSIEQDLGEFNLEDYPQLDNGTVSVLNFAEFGYASIKADSNYGIYMYVYNPTEGELSVKEGDNVANMAIAYNDNGDPIEYANIPLTVIDASDNHRFYKFRVSSAQAFEERVRAYASRHGERRYDITGLQLRRVGTVGADGVKDHDIQATYYVKGYSAGYDAFGDEESTLEVYTDKLEVVNLDIQSTYWRDSAINANGAGHHNQLSSVYFSIPKKFVNNYGDLYKVKCSWDERRTTPVIVTNRNDVYSTLMAEYGLEATGNITLCDNYEPVGTYGHYAQADWSYNYDETTHTIMSDKTPIGYIFKTPTSDILGYRVSSAQMKEWIEARGQNAPLFTNDVDEGRTYGEQIATFEADKPFNMKSFNSTATDFQKWITNWGLTKWDYGEDKRIEEPIKLLKDEDFSKTTQENADTLFINEYDYNDFKKYYDENKIANDVFLLRFAVTDYYANMQSVWYGGAFENVYGDMESTYMARETVFLNFDVIELTFQLKNGTEKVIGVVANPKDIVADITGPVSENFDWVIWFFAITFILLAIGIISSIVKNNLTPTDVAEMIQYKLGRK